MVNVFISGKLLLTVNNSNSNNDNNSNYFSNYY